MVVVRPATEADIPRILDLYGQLSLGPAPSETDRHPAPGHYKQVFNRMTAVSGLELVVADEGGEVIGSLVLLIVPNLSHNGLPWALVENVIVDERHRRHGVGRLLMNYAVDRAKSEGCYRIGLSSDNRRAGAHEFYSSLGFEASAVGFRLYF